MKAQIFAFRVDASNVIGTGHVVRCLTLAEELRRKGGRCLFICRRQSGDLIEYIQNQGFETHAIIHPNESSNKNMFQISFDAQSTQRIIENFDIDWMIIDHYEIDIYWENLIRSLCRNIMIIDDLANRRHDCDILLDQNLRSNAVDRYRSLLPDKCLLIQGPEHVILRPDFDAPSGRCRDGILHHVLVYFGGNDHTNQAFHALLALQNFSELTADIVLGSNHPYKVQLQDLSNEKLIVHEMVNMADAMKRADLALGVCGIAAWERCAMGLPALVCISADNQIEDAESLHALGAVENLGSCTEVGSSRWTKALANAITSPDRMIRMGNAAMSIVEGHVKNRQLLINRLMSN
jgi:UDP-2,4-diacetamido-2,4,6-trideoxy-beta-L-altropyranose hydrolase